MAHDQAFLGVYGTGGLIPADMLVRIDAGGTVTGSAPADYHVIGTRSVAEAAERHWEDLKAAWRGVRERFPSAPGAGVAADPEGYAVTGWLNHLMDALGFGRLTAVGSAGISADDGTTAFPVSHRWNHVPIHLLPWHADLDRRLAGPGTAPPQSILQECLNRTGAHLWGLLGNGRRLRLLRDSSALATVSYVEFDLEGIFDGELLHEFVLLYRLLHVSRFEIEHGVPPSSCRLEKWREEAIASGTRALDQHRGAVQEAITALGTGFLKHPANTALRRDLDLTAFHTALLGLVYRLIFLFAAEDRDVLHPPGAPELARRRYSVYFSTARLRRHAARRRGTGHTDLYQALRFVLDALADERGRPELGLIGLGGIFEDTPEDAPLHGLVIANEDLLLAVRHLSTVWEPDTRRRRAIDYRNIDSEELGSIYESLLELVPKHSADRHFELIDVAGGNDRKKTGSYYTPTALIERLLDTSLDPVIDAAQRVGEQLGGGDSGAVVAELLKLTVCDPACGSGHFLVAAARRIAKRVAAVRERNPEPPLPALRHALHEVIGRCVYGVDLNPTVVKLAKMSLWLEAQEPGKAMSFLDGHIKVGNALIGATPALLRDGIPTKAFGKPIEGDDPGIVKALAAQNEQERGGQEELFSLLPAVRVSNAGFVSGLHRIAGAPATTLGEVRRQAAAYREWVSSPDYAHRLHVADTWCAAFVWPKTKQSPPAVTDGMFRALQDPDGTAPAGTHAEIIRLAEDHRFFHWHLAFPEIFRVPDRSAGEHEEVDPVTGWAGGFSCVLANPPWDKVDFEDKKYFSRVEPDIAAMPGLARRTRIAEWVDDFPEAGAGYRAERRRQKALFHFASTSGTFPLCAKGLTVKGVTMLQTDQLFAERFTAIASGQGRVGCIVQTAIATNAGAQHLFRDLTDRAALVALYDFENRRKLFDIHASFKFCLLSLVGRDLRAPAARLVFFLQQPADLDDESRFFQLSSEEISLVSPNTGSLPIFRTRRDADLTVAIYGRIPVLWREGSPTGNPWDISFKTTLFHMTDDSDLFRDSERLESEGWKLCGNVFARDREHMLPLYEAKMVDFFNHRAADVVKSETAVNRQNQPRYLGAAELDDPQRFAMPLNWIAEEGEIAVTRNGKEVDVPGVAKSLEELKWNHEWLCGWCDVTASTNERTAIPGFVPRAAVGHTFPLMLSRAGAPLTAALIAAQSSLVFDFVSRQKVTDAHMKLFIWKQLPVPVPADMKAHLPFIVPRVLELVYTAFDMRPLARDLGDEGEPFRWDEERRARLRAELDAYFFHLYGVGRDDVDYILESFQSDSGGGLKNNEIARYGTYRTKDLVMAEYDRLASAGVGLQTPADGEAYRSVLTPPPGYGPRH